jgi:uncharacterized protein involved in response to NO
MTGHVHEMVFGFVMAAIAGFLLIVVVNWVGRPSTQGFHWVISCSLGRSVVTAFRNSACLRK